jgi:hypothetical protein
VANLYRGRCYTAFFQISTNLDNAFHNFKHALHVTMSTMKLMSQIVPPEILKPVPNDQFEFADDNLLIPIDREDINQELHDHTYGIKSDPLTLFAFAFLLLVHDDDHCGVPSTQLVYENCPIAHYHCNQSVAEQHSLISDVKSIPQ